MKIYARIENGVVMEIIKPLLDDDGNEFSVAARFVPELVAQMIDVTSASPIPAQRWTYDGTTFTPPAI
ncbi:hypothetical protein B0G84_2321 [Paraburkholderia sp. BL8N3]|nr:hypothetical protein [Paraburkholderia sp. BL8N3]TCK43973.1 hypothetical protein B0G84_2321 [Paraburkholderia sp. BL8N3]